MFRYSIYFACRALSAGLGYALSVIGISIGSDFGRLIAFLDAAKPISGLFDALATRALGRVIALQMLLNKGVVLLLALGAISLIANDAATVAIISSYVVIWWMLTSFSTLFMRNEHVKQYRRLLHRTGFLLKTGIRRILTNRSTLTFMATSTLAAAAYANLYLFAWTKQELLTLRLIDATLLLVSFTAQLVIRGETLNRRTWVGTGLATLFAAACAQYLAGGWMGPFLLLRVGSLLACARAMKYRRDHLISLNQALLASAYVAFALGAKNSDALPGLLLIEVISLLTLVSFGGAGKAFRR